MIQKKTSPYWKLIVYMSKKTQPLLNEADAIKQKHEKNQKTVKRLAWLESWIKYSLNIQRAALQHHLDYLCEYYD